MSDAKQPNGSKAEDLCLACGLCCDGVLFADVKLQSEDSPAAFASLQALSSGNLASGASERQLVPRSAARASFIVGKKALRVPQPCVAFDGCRCRIYPDRPKHCRQFECLLLRSARLGRTSKADALAIIGKARGRVDKVWRLLRELGNFDEDQPLSRRFRQTAKRLERSQLDEHAAGLFSELTLAVHDLNCLLSSAFYTG